VEGVVPSGGGWYLVEGGSTLWRGVVPFGGGWYLVEEVVPL